MQPGPTVAPGPMTSVETKPPWAGLRWPILLSILGPVAWLVFTLLYVGFWAKGFSLFQSIIVVLVSLLVLFGVVAAAWATWGMSRFSRGRWNRWRRYAEETPPR